ncbi:MAG TPA: lytic transglycosylase domain-containing protein [Thermoanaerobaculia bacterium]|nr:lytic transglycosylase domain-containing protein [Thermoanaerobaculia bacterium]
MPKQEVAQIRSYLQRLGRRSSPVCISAFAFSLVNLAGPAAPTVHPPALQPAAVVQQAAASPAQAPLAQAPAPKVDAPAAVEAPKPEPPGETAKTVPAEAPKAASPAPVAAPASPAPAPTPAPVAATPAPTPAPAPPPAPLSSLEQLRKAADLLAEANAAMGAPKSPYGQLIYDIAIRHSVNPQLVAAVIHVESAFNARAVSRKGACGLMQLLPATARRFGVTKKKDLFDPKKNLEAGVKYLKWLTARFGGDVQKTLAAYNAGEGAVDRFGGVPPYRETQNYVQKIFGLLGFTPDPPAAKAALPAAQVAEAEIVPAGR